MTIVLGKQGTSSTIENVVSFTLVNKDNPTVQVIHKSGNTVHVDMIQSQEILNINANTFGG